MAKMRVYELARDLNLTNKMLLSKLSDLDISVKSHMSSLDDETVARIKSAIFGKEKTEAVEETRIKPTVIRRRRTKVEVEAAPEPPAVPDDEAAVEKPAEAAGDDDGVETEAAAMEKTGEIVDGKTAEDAVPVEEIPAEEKPDDKAAPAAEAAKPADLKEKKSKKAVKKVKPGESAKIIQLPVKPVLKPSKKKAAPGDKAKVERLPSRQPAVKRPSTATEDAKTVDGKKKK